MKREYLKSIINLALDGAEHSKSFNEKITEAILEEIETQEKKLIQTIKKELCLDNSDKMKYRGPQCKTKESSDDWTCYTCERIDKILGEDK